MDMGTQCRCKLALPEDLCMGLSSLHIQSLGVGEQGYLSKRKPYLNPAINKQLARVGLPQPDRTPVIGLALSGGGYRAMQYVFLLFAL